MVCIFRFRWFAPSVWVVCLFRFCRLHCPPGESPPPLNIPTPTGLRGNCHGIASSMPPALGWWLVGLSRFGFHFSKCLACAEWGNHWKFMGNTNVPSRTHIQTHNDHTKNKHKHENKWSTQSEHTADTSSQKHSNTNTPIPNERQTHQTHKQQTTNMHIIRPPLSQS